MMMTQHLTSSDSLRDDGPLSAADGLLSRRFRLWRGRDGRRQVFSVYGVEDAPDYPDAVAIAVRTVGGQRVAMWSGPAGAKARAAARAAGAQEIHLRIIPEIESGSLAPL